ncbi:hypothetical protein [Opacimonas viscosa]|uniref:KfrA N-terminal DNA-binding domain-containing protein n=1 Tax=Opacimonas viscosa TaxID=2961944 RepID=A0AA41WWC2_9ALTE|nr:hypothetical protein [Opacimonas viscosa]MCP3427759.1 hypothetical protein [Opacimonas viscosa]
MTSSNQTSILQICAQIEAKGLTISSGLVKAKLSEKLPLPQILAGIAAYKSGARATKGSLPVTESTTPKVDSIPTSPQGLLTLIQQQNAQIERLLVDVAELKSQVQALQKER